MSSTIFVSIQMIEITDSCTILQVCTISRNRDKNILANTPAKKAITQKAVKSFVVNSSIVYPNKKDCEGCSQSLIYVRS